MRFLRTKKTSSVIPALVCRKEPFEPETGVAFGVRLLLSYEEGTTVKNCGCTLNSPGCERGRILFRTAQQMAHSMHHPSLQQRNDHWLAQHLAQLAYLDHVNGWCDGDIKVQRKTGIWMVFVRLGGQWIFWFASHDAGILRLWLADRGYEQYVCVARPQRFGARRPPESLLGYYHRTISRQTATFAAETQRSLFPDGAPGAEGTTPLDPETQGAILVALLLAPVQRELTRRERLEAQRSIVRLLSSCGKEVGWREERIIAHMIEEVARQQAFLRSQVARSPVQRTQQATRATSRPQKKRKTER